MEEIKKLIDFYLTTEHVYSFEAALEKLVSYTNTENYMDITNYILDHTVKVSELDISMYIVEIANKYTVHLLPIITEKLESFTDKDAIEDLQEASNRITS